MCGWTLAAAMDLRLEYQDGGNSHGKRKKAARRTLSVDTCGSLPTFCEYEDTERVAGPFANHRNGLLEFWC